MKMIYTLAELNALTPEELQELVYFGNDAEYLYSNIVGFNPKINSLIMKDGTSLEAASTEGFNSYKKRKLRFDMVQATLAGINQNNASKDNLRKEVKELVEEQISALKESFTAISTNALKTFKNTERQLETTVASIQDNFVIIEDALNDKLKKIDTDQFGPKMKKVDKIIDAFKELLD